MKKSLIAILISLTCFFSFSVIAPSVAVAEQKRLKKEESHKFTLYEAPSKRDAYSQKFLIKLDEAGMITVNASVGGGKIKGNENPFKLWIVEARGIHEDTNKIEKKYIKQTARFKRLGFVDYPVDSLALDQTKGEYAILISNLSKKSHGVGTITITYPAKDEKPGEEAGKRHKRD